jgi:hypothetical protein
MGATDRIGVALRMTTVGPTVAVFRIGSSNCVDNGTGEQYDGDLIAWPEFTISVPGPTSAIATTGSISISIANFAGELSQAVNEGVTFEGAQVESWWTINEEFDSLTDPVLFGGEIDEESISLDDDRLECSAFGPMRALENIQFPSRFITDPDAPSQNRGKLLPVRFGRWGNGNRYSEFLCTNALTGKITLHDSKAADGTWIRMSAVVGIPTGGNKFQDSDKFLIARADFDPRNPKAALSQGLGSKRRTLAYIDCTGQDENRATFEIGNRVEVVPPPEDVEEPVEPVDPCVVVEATPVEEDPTLTEQCPATDPRTPKTSKGGERATEFDPENDVVLGKHGGPSGINPDGDTYHSNVSSFGGISDTILRRYIGVHADKLATETFLSPTEWPGTGTQTGLTYQNAPQLEQQYALGALLAQGALENRALFYEDGGKIALRQARFVGSVSDVVYDIDPSVVVAGSFKVVPGRWGVFANDVTFTAYGHGVAPDLLPYAMAHAENADSIAERAAAKQIPRVPYVVGQDLNQTFGLWLDGARQDQFTEACGDLLAILSSRHRILEMVLCPPVEEFADVKSIRLGDFVRVVWPSCDDSLGVPRSRQPLIPEDEPAICPVIGLSPSPINGTFKLRVVQYISAGGSDAGLCVYAKYMDPSATFPAYLGGGPMLPWDDEWTDDQKAYASCHGGFYGRHKYQPA